MLAKSEADVCLMERRQKDRQHLGLPRDNKDLVESIENAISGALTTALGPVLQSLQSAPSSCNSAATNSRDSTSSYRGGARSSENIRKRR